MKKAYEVEINGVKMYVEWSYAGLRKIQEMAYILEMDIVSKVVDVPNDTKLW